MQLQFVVSFIALGGSIGQVWTFAPPPPLLLIEVSLQRLTFSICKRKSKVNLTNLQISSTHVAYTQCQPLFVTTRMTSGNQFAVALHRSTLQPTAAVRAVGIFI